jgi:hypothetical protein
MALRLMLEPTSGVLALPQNMVVSLLPEMRSGTLALHLRQFRHNGEKPRRGHGNGVQVLLHQTHKPLAIY